MAKEMIECSNCWKLIEKKWIRTMCIRCRNLADKIRMEAIRQTQEFKEIAHAKYMAKKRGLI